MHEATAVGTDVIRVSPYGAALDPVGLEALRITERVVESVEEMREAGGVAEIAEYSRMMCGITVSPCVPCHASLVAPNGQDRLKIKSKPRFDDRRSLVHAHSRLENKVTSDAIDWEFPVALRYGLTRQK